MTTPLSLSDLPETFEPDTTERAIDHATRHREERRGYLGLSGIGSEDERALWLDWRWSLPVEVQPRTRRIFDLGHILEEEVIRILRAAGIQYHDVDPDGNQFGYRLLGGHLRGHCDGFCRKVPEAPAAWHLGEIKSANSKRCAELRKLLSEHDPNTALHQWSETYYTQVHCYMGEESRREGSPRIERCLYVVYNKDTSDIIAFRVKYDRMAHERAISKAERILEADEPPPSPYGEKDYRVANFMSEEKRAVYLGKQAPKPNCRNCRFARPDLTGADGLWRCTHPDNGHVLTVAQQRTGCPGHNFIPALVPATLKHIGDRTATYETEHGELINAPHTDEGHGLRSFSSWEIAEVSRGDFTYLSDPMALDVRVEFKARLVGTAPPLQDNEKESTAA